VAQRENIGAILVREGLVTDDDLQVARGIQAESGEALTRVLVDESMIDEAKLVRVLAEHMGIEYVNLADVTVDPTAALLIPETLARRYSVIPYGFDGDALLIAMADPSNVLVIDDIRAITGMQVVSRISTRSDILDAVRRMGAYDDSVSDLADLMTDDEESEDLSSIEAAVEEAPIVQLVNTLVTRAVNERASDIHIEPGEHDLRIRFRIDGVLHEVMSSPRSVSGAVVSRLKIMAELDIAERRVPQDGRVSLRVTGRQIDLRVATLPSIYGEKVVIRILDKDDAVLDLPDLGFLPESLDRFETSYTKPYGTILVTGPTGSGKTTTQVQVNRKAGLQFHTVLKSILRSDPDIILIGEVRDGETAAIAIEAALTGHLVLTTLHTNDAASSVGRLIDMGVEPYLVSSSIDSILAQRLARLICDRCKAPKEVSGDLVSQMGFDPDEGPLTIYDAVGCKVCSDTGYRGRLCINEILLMSEEIQHLAVERRPSDEIKNVAIEQGMKTLRRDGMDKVRMGLTTLEEVMRVVV